EALVLVVAIALQVLQAALADLVVVGQRRVQLEDGFAHQLFALVAEQVRERVVALGYLARAADDLRSRRFRECQQRQVVVPHACLSVWRPRDFPRAAGDELYRAGAAGGTTAVGAARPHGAVG